MTNGRKSTALATLLGGVVLAVALLAAGGVVAGGDDPPPTEPPVAPPATPTPDAPAAAAPAPAPAAPAPEPLPRIIRTVCTDHICGHCDGKCHKNSGHVALDKKGHCACTPTEGGALDRATRDAYEKNPPQ